ncbi:GspH/FimT family pseudopilin [Sphingomonas sp. MA1305]|uniref:GspH/FimT family pseudopilin n=1 Tax=Sphingomonas sp. MA1305 TaxID=2479204 RepID=UPI002FCD21B4
MRARRSAEHGFTPISRSAEHGFTLVELMVVVVVIALAASVAMFAMPDPRGRLADEAARFSLRARAAHDAAIVEGRAVSLWITPAGYGFDRRVEGTWLPMADKPLRVTRWNDGTLARIDGATGGRLRVTFDPTGLADRPAQLVLSRGQARAVIDMAADGSVRVAG